MARTGLEERQSCAIPCRIPRPSAGRGREYQIFSADHRLPSAANASHQAEGA